MRVQFFCLDIWVLKQGLGIQGQGLGFRVSGSGLRAEDTGFGMLKVQEAQEVNEGLVRGSPAFEPSLLAL